MYGKHLKKRHTSFSPIKRISAILLLLLLARVVFAHLMYDWSYQEMFKKADLVVVAKPASTTNTSERTTLSGDLHVVGLSTTFETLLILKGDKNLKIIVLHHYRLSDPGEVILNGPAFVDFRASNPLPFLLFLVKEPDGRYAPATDQIDPGASSVIQLHGPSR